VQLDGTSGHTQPHLATSGECLLSSRSRVRIALGAHVKAPGQRAELGVHCDPLLLAIFLACHIRATASGILSCRAEFGLNASGYRVGQHVLTLVGGMQIHQRGMAGGVTHTFHQFAEVRPGLSYEYVASMAQVVKVDAQARGGQGGDRLGTARVTYPECIPGRTSPASIWIAIEGHISARQSRKRVVSI